MSSLLNHAKSELRAAGLFAPDADYNGEVAVAVIALVELFASQGHSGGSADATVAIFAKLASFKPLLPLTGEDDEWIDRSVESGYPLWQNNRYSSVFKNDKIAWDVKLMDGRLPITFPYAVK